MGSTLSNPVTWLIQAKAHLIQDSGENCLIYMSKIVDGNNYTSDSPSGIKAYLSMHKELNRIVEYFERSTVPTGLREVALEWIPSFRRALQMILQGNSASAINAILNKDTTFNFQMRACEQLMQLTPIPEVGFPQLKELSEKLSSHAELLAAANIENHPKIALIAATNALKIAIDHFRFFGIANIEEEISKAIWQFLKSSNSFVGSTTKDWTVKTKDLFIFVFQAVAATVVGDSGKEALESIGKYLEYFK
jgi:hypothetical protein